MGLLWKHEDLSLNPCHLHEKLDIATHASKAQQWGVETGGSQKPSSLVKGQVRYYHKAVRWENKRERHYPPLDFSCTHMDNALTYLYASLVCTYNTTHTKKSLFKKRTCLFIVLPHLLMGLLDISVFCGSWKFIIDIPLCQTSASRDFLPSCKAYPHLVICFCCCTKFFCLISCVSISQCQPYFLNYSGPQEAIICGYPALLFSFLYPLAVQQFRSSIKIFDPFGVDFCAEWEIEI